MRGRAAFTTRVRSARLPEASAAHTEGCIHEDTAPVLCPPILVAHRIWYAAVKAAVLSGGHRGSTAATGGVFAASETPSTWGSRSA